MDKTILSATIDSGTTSNIGKYSNSKDRYKDAQEFKMTGKKSSKVFTIDTGAKTSTQEK